MGAAVDGAVEDDVGHVLAAQMAGGALPQHPAHGVDDVGFAAAVGACNDSDWVRKADRQVPDATQILDAHRLQKLGQLGLLGAQLVPDLGKGFLDQTHGDSLSSSGSTMIQQCYHQRTQFR